MWHQYVCVFITLLTTINGSGSTSSISNREYLSMPILFHLDDFDRCMMYEDNEAIYCFITFQLKPENPQNPSSTWKTIEKISAESRNYRHDKLRHGICLPETCRNINTSLTDPELTDKITKCYNLKYKNQELVGEITQINCQSKQSPYIFGLSHFIFAVFVVSYLVFIVFATLHEGLARYKTEDEYKKITESTSGEILGAFALTKNWIRLKTVNFDNPEVVFFRPIQGIRFYNMALVILMHTVMQNVALPVSNPIYVETVNMAIKGRWYKITEKFLNLFLANGGYAVQTSFMLSTLFLTYNFLKTFEKQKNIPIRDLFKAFTYRYIRLTPSLAFLVAFHSTWLVFLGRGPFWDEIIGEEYRRCTQNGWSNILFINNYVNPEKMCLPHTWYMACDTQFFIIALFAIWLIKRNAKWLFPIVFSIFAVHISSLFYAIYSNNWESTIRPNPEYLYAYSVLNERMWHVILGSNYSNSAGLPAGLVMGYIIYHYKDKQIFTTKKRVVIWWFLIWGFSLGIIIIPGSIIYSKNYQHNRLFAAIYGSLSRTIFITGIGVGIFGLCQGIGWLMKRTCEWYPTYVLGRVSYTAYLVHFTFIIVRSSSTRTLNYLSDYNMFNELFSNIVMSYIGAFALTLLVEMPISQLQKVLQTRIAKTKHH